jgi:hypothetical protein
MTSVPTVRSIRRLAPLLAAAAAAAALTPAAGSRPAALPTLYVDYTMSCTFAITDDGGKKVSSIPPGTYQVQIQTPVPFGGVDLTGVHDMTACQSYVQFQLTGPGVSLTSTLNDGDSSFWLYTETFQPSATYTAQDLNQASVTRTTFATAATGSAAVQTGGGTSTASTGTSSSKAKGTASTDIVGSEANPFRGSLDAIVFKSGKLSLTRNGKVVRSLKEGRWTFSVDDESGKAGFGVQVLRGKAQTITSAPFVGNHDVTVTLKPGRWSFFTAGGKKTAFFVVS